MKRRSWRKKKKKGDEEEELKEEELKEEELKEEELKEEEEEDDRLSTTSSPSALHIHLEDDKDESIGNLSVS